MSDTKKAHKQHLQKSTQATSVSIPAEPCNVIFAHLHPHEAKKEMNIAAIHADTN